MKNYLAYIFSLSFFFSLSCLAHSPELDDLKQRFKNNPCLINPRLGCCKYDVYTFIKFLLENGVIPNSEKIKVYKIEQKNNILQLKNSTLDIAFKFHIFFSYSYNGQEYIFDYLTHSYGELELEEWLRQGLVASEENYILDSWKFEDYVEYVEGDDWRCPCNLL